MRCLLLVLAMLILATPARANHGPELRDPLFLRSLEVAREHWGRADPPCRSHGVLYEPFDFELARAEIFGCRIWISYDLERRPAVRYCSIVVHEYGHNIGYQHSAESTSVMNPVVADGGHVPACRREFRRCRRHWHPRGRGPPRLHRHCRVF